MANILRVLFFENVRFAVAAMRAQKLRSFLTLLGIVAGVATVIMMVSFVVGFNNQIVASGGHLWACRMSADMMHLTEDDLYDDVEGIINAADFIEKADGAQLLFI